MNLLEASEMLTFATYLEAHFANGTITLPRGFPILFQSWHKAKMNHAPYTVTVSGKLNLSYDGNPSSVNADCRFRIFHDWRLLQPEFVCRENWISRPSGHRRADWHIYSNDSFCYVHHEQWHDTIRDTESCFGTGAALFDAAFLAVNNVRWLLAHHLYAYRNNLSEWPKDWPQWDHGDAGTLAYRRSKMNQHK